MRGTAGMYDTPVAESTCPVCGCRSLVLMEGRRDTDLAIMPPPASMDRSQAPGVLMAKKHPQGAAVCLLPLQRKKRGSQALVNSRNEPLPKEPQRVSW